MKPGSVFVYASTKDVYGANAAAYDRFRETCPTDCSGQTPLEWSKLIASATSITMPAGEMACIFRLSTVYARPSDGNQYGFVTHYVESVKRGWPIQVPVGGQAIRDILHVDDFSRACQAFIASSISYGQYNLGGGKENATTLTEMISTVGKLIQLEPVIEYNDALSHPVPINYVSDLSLVREQLGWQPEIGLKEGLRSLL